MNHPPLASPQLLKGQVQMLHHRRALRRGSCLTKVKPQQACMLHGAQQRGAQLHLASIKVQLAERRKGRHVTKRAHIQKG